MEIFSHFCHGIMSVLKVTSAPLLYRYPYRNSAQGLRSDWSAIGQDIHSVVGKLATDKDHGK
jgi:hypothetical protein